jgi:hypothetical protein
MASALSNCILKFSWSEDWEVKKKLIKYQNKDSSLSFLSQQDSVCDDSLRWMTNMQVEVYKLNLMNGILFFLVIAETK